MPDVVVAGVPKGNVADVGDNPMLELVAAIPNGAAGVVPNGTELFMVVGKDKRPTAGADAPNPPPNGLIAAPPPHPPTACLFFFNS